MDILRMIRFFAERCLYFATSLLPNEVKNAITSLFSDHSALQNSLFPQKR
jgi:hypothetical protein